MTTLRDAIQQRAADDPQGITMGALVDALEREGYAPSRVEAEIWSMLAARLLTPSGYVCRVVRRAGADGRPLHSRRYEWLLAPWSAERDHELAEGRAP